MKDPDSSGIEFRVAETFLEDVGRGLARLDAEDLKRLGAVPGDCLLIAGRRATVGRAAQVPLSHCGQRLILVDGTVRDNAQIGVDEWVTVRKVPFMAAESILLAPVQAHLPIPTEAEIPHLRQLLSGIPVVLGDRLQVTFMGGRPRSFTVEGAVPRGALLISADTAIAFKVPEVSAEKAYRVSYEDIGGLMIWGLQPGPMLFKDNPDFVWGLIASTWYGNILGLIIVLAFAPLFAAVLRTPFPILMPLLIFICSIGAYAVNNRMIDIWYMMIFGVIGWAFKKLDYNMAPMLLALVLGDMAESAMRQSLIMSEGSPLIFLRPPICLPLVMGAFLIFFWPAVKEVRARIRSRKELRPPEKPREP